MEMLFIKITTHMLGPSNWRSVEHNKCRVRFNYRCTVNNVLGWVDFLYWNTVIAACLNLVLRTNSNRTILQEGLSDSRGRSFPPHTLLVPPITQPSSSQMFGQGLPPPSHFKFLPIFPAMSSSLVAPSSVLPLSNPPSKMRVTFVEKQIGPCYFPV